MRNFLIALFLCLIAAVAGSNNVLVDGRSLTDKDVMGDGMPDGVRRHGRRKNNGGAGARRGMRRPLRRRRRKNNRRNNNNNEDGTNKPTGRRNKNKNPRRRRFRNRLRRRYGGGKLTCEADEMVPCTTKRGMKEGVYYCRTFKNKSRNVCRPNGQGFNNFDKCGACPDAM